MSKSITKSIRLNQEEHEDLALLAEHENVKFSKIIHKAINHYIAHEYELIKMIKDKK